MTPWVLRLLVLNVAVFFLTDGFNPGASPIFRLLTYVPAAVLVRPWTPITYMFLHAGFWHLAFNMLGLYFFGPRLETRIGSRHFIMLYLVAGLTGALASFFFESHARIVGASGAVLGVLLGFAHFWPHERIYIWGILPIPARVMVIGFAILSIVIGFSGSGGGIAHFAHLGGFAGAWLYLRVREHRAGAFRRRATPERERSPLDRISGKAAREQKQWDAIRVESLHEINRQEVERIRAKIREKGATSLTPDERAFMNRMSA